MLKRSNYLVFICATAAIPVWAMANAAFAQTTSTAAASAQDSEGGTQLQEIVVTAQKRAQNVQDAPLSVTAIGGERLAAANITQVQDLNRVDPALQIGYNSGAIQTFIRGLGSPVTTAGIEASVPVYIDDVYYIRASPVFFDLSNVDRVEILKGPQGTLFGRNASGGVVSVYTRDPTGNALVSGKIGYGNYDTVYGQFYAGGSLSDTLAADISASASRQGDGWGRNITTGGDAYKQKYVSLRSKLVWTPAETTKVQLIGYFATNRSDIGIIERPFPGTQGASPPDPAAHGFVNPGYPAPQPYSLGGFYDTQSNSPQYLRAKGYGGSVRIDQELSFADLVSITAFRRSKEFYNADADYTPYNLSEYKLDIIDRQISQEIQLKSKASSKVNWIIGGYYLRATQGFAPTLIIGEGPTASGVNSVSITGIQRVRSYAAFGQVTYPITDTTNLTGGLRYTIDKVLGYGKTVYDVIGFGPVVAQLFDKKNDFGGANGVTIVNGVNPNASKTFKKLTWKAAIDQKLSEDVMAYLSYSRGYKAGTYNTLPLQAAPLKPEIVDAYEIGLKTELFDRRLRLNGALFWDDVKDPQVQTSSLGVVALLNAGKARTRGAEIDGELVVARGLNLRFSGTYLDATYRDFPNAPFYFYSSPGILSVTTVDAAGHKLPFASKFKFSGGVNYSLETTDGAKIVADVGLSYQTRYNWDADNVIKEPSRFLVDASVALTPATLSNLTFRVWVKNLTDDKYNIGYLPQATGAAYASAPGAPRTFGGEIGFKF